MKKHLLLLPLVAMFALTGCNNGEGSGEGSSGGATGLTTSVPMSAQEGKNKLSQLVKGDGFELKYHTSSGDFLIGGKNNYWWVEGDGDGTMFFKDESENVSMYTRSSAEEPYELVGTVQQNALDMSFESMTEGLFSFYNEFESDPFYYVGTVNFAGRSANEYRLVVEGITASAEVQVILDKEYGITLLYNASGKAYTDEGYVTGEAYVEVKSFVTGSAVSVPPIAE